MSAQPNRSSANELADDCPCPGVFKATAFCPDCPYRATQTEENQHA